MQKNIYVENSLMKARWAMPDVPLDDVEKLARAHDLPEVVARMLLGRGIDTSDLDAFLKPTLAKHFPDPFKLKDMDDMAIFMAAAIDAGRKVAIFGDFDVDGATSSAILYRFLKAVGQDAPIYIPDRLSEGYGPNIAAFEKLKAKGADIIMVLDCGTTAYDVIQAGRDMGLDIVILDHHEAEDKLAAANFVINPKRKDDESGYDMLAACGVVFLACVAMNKKLRELGFYTQNGINEPDLRRVLDLVGLGTVCDMVPLTGPNRLFVKQGFAMMAGSGNEGLRALIEVSKITGEITPYHAGFVLGPRINAGSRVHEADLGARLLSGKTAHDALIDMAWSLNDCNDQRKAIQAEMERDALRQVEEKGLDQNAVIIVSDESYHPGLSGLVAGRLKEKYNKPACVVTFAKGENGVLEGRGSGRSIAGVHIAEAFMDARKAGLIVKGGGHAMAGGFTVLPEKLDDFIAFMNDHVQKQMSDGQSHVVTDIDGIVTVQGANAALIRLLNESVGPFGQEHPDPLFLFQNVKLHSVDIVGEAHIRCMISDWEGGKRMKAMAFRAVGTDLGEALLKHGRAPFHIVGQLKLDTWNGQERIELHVRDASLAHSAEMSNQGRSDLSAMG